jgi:hypothetical protein
MGSTVLAVFGALGGLAVFVGAIWAVIRAGARQVAATEANTVSLDKATQAIDRLETKVTALDTTVQVQGSTITTQGREIGELRKVIFNGGRH